MYCRKCGTKLSDDSVFCEKCGTRVEEEKLESSLKEPTHEIDIKEMKEKNIDKQLKERLDEEQDKELAEDLQLSLEKKELEKAVSDLAPDDFDITITKGNKFKIVIVIVIILIIGIAFIILFNKDKKEVKKEKTIDYQSIINEYAKSIEDVASDYLIDHELINDYSEISSLVKYDKHKVSCENISINIDGTVYLSECSVDGKTVDEVYGRKKSILTKDQEACHIDNDSENNQIKFYSDGELASIYECDYHKCGQYKTEDFEYNSCQDMITIIEDGEDKYLYNYQAGQKITDPIEEIIPIKQDDKLSAFIIKLSDTKKYGIIDTRGVTKIKFDYDDLALISNNTIYDRGMNIVEDKIIASKDGKYGVIKYSNEEQVIDFKYDNIYLAENGYYVVKEGKLYYLIDSNEEKVLENGYDMIFAFKDLLVISNEDKLTITDYKGEKIIEDEIDVLVDYKEEAVEGIFGYNAYRLDNKIIIEVNDSSSTGYNTIKYTYDIENKTLTKEN